jgi:hypothetical protein
MWYSGKKCSEVKIREVTIAVSVSHDSLEARDCREVTERMRIVPENC